MLNEAEKHLSNTYNINTYRIVAWHQRNRKNTSLRQFYYKNGYKQEFDSKKRKYKLYMMMNIKKLI